MSTYKTYAMLADGGGGGTDVNDDPNRILQSAQEKEDLFDQLTKDLEVERKAVSNQLEKYRLGSDTATLSSISSTNNSFHWRPAPPDAILEEESDLGSRVASPQLIDSVLQVLSDKNGEKMSSVGYGHPNSYQHAVYPNSNQSRLQETGSRSSLDRGVPPSTAIDRRPLADNYLTAVPSSEQYAAVNGQQQQQRDPRYADNFLDASMPLPSYGTVHHNNDSLDRYVPHSSQQRSQQHYRGNTNYVPSESDRESDRGSVRQPVGASSRTSTANRQPVGQQPGSRYPDDSSVRGSVQSLSYGQQPGNAPRPSADDSNISRSVMNAVSAPPPSSPRYQDQQPHFVNNAYQPDLSDLQGYEPDDRGPYRPNDSYSGRSYQPSSNARPQYPNSAYDPEPDFLNRSHASIDRAHPQQLPVGNVMYSPDYGRGARSPSEAGDYPPDDRYNSPAGGYRVNGNGSLPHDTAVLQSTAYKPFETIAMPVTTVPVDGEAGSWRNPDLQEVIDFLSHPSNAVKVNAAAHLQHLSYMNDGMKGKIGRAGGIPPLVALLSHEMPEVQRAACGALRNLSFGRANDENKRAIKEADGLRALVKLLRQTNDNEIRELVTGILWNMSSCLDLKKPIVDVAMAALVEVVVIPQAGIDPRSLPPQKGNVYWTTVFRNTSGTLRNVSSDGPYTRKRLRECPGLVEAVVGVLNTAIARNDIDNKSVENLVCLLRNLSFACQETVDPDYLAKRSAQNQDASKNCFGGNKSPKKESDKKKSKNDSSKNSSTSPTPSSSEFRGAQMLWHPLIVKVYHPILADSSNPETLEAAAGALQNLCACDWQPSAQLRTAVRQQLMLPVLAEVLSLDADNVVRSATFALRNLAIDEHNRELIGKLAMRQFVSKLPEKNVAPVYPVSDDTIAASVAVVYEVVKHNIDFAWSFLNEGGVDRLNYINENRTQFHPRVVNYTQLLLYTMWKEFPALHDEYKRRNFTEQTFIPKSSGSSKQKASAPNTMTRPHMNQGASSYSQQTPKPISRHPPNLPPDGNDSFVRQDNHQLNNQLNSSIQDRNWQDIPLNDEQVPMTYMGASRNNNNEDAFYNSAAPSYHPTGYRDSPDARYAAVRPDEVSLTYPAHASPYTPTHPADDNHYGSIHLDDRGGRYTPSHVVDAGSRNTPIHVADSGRYTPTRGADGGGRYTPTPVGDSRYSVVPPPAVSYQPSYQPHTNTFHGDDLAVGAPSQEPIYSHVNRQNSQTSSQQRLDLPSAHASALQVDSWV